VNVVELLESVWRHVGAIRVPSDYQLLQLATDLRAGLWTVDEPVSWTDKETVISGVLAADSVALPAELLKVPLRVRVAGQDVPSLTWPYDQGDSGFYVKTLLGTSGAGRQEVVLVGYDDAVASGTSYEIRAVLDDGTLVPTSDPTAKVTNLAPPFDRLLVAQLAEQYATEAQARLVQRLLKAANAEVATYQQQRFQQLSVGGANVDGYEEW